MGLFALIVVSAAATKILAQESFMPCTREGVQCRDCHTVGNCIPDGKGGFMYDENTMDTCPRNVVCDEKTWFCERKGYCRYKRFVCPTNDYDEETLFPDPYSCTQFHGCFGTQQFDYSCDQGTAFDPVNGSCSLEIDDRTCKDYVVPLCESPHQRGTIFGTFFHYECVEENGPPPVLYPRIYLVASTPATTDPASSEATSTVSTTHLEASSHSVNSKSPTCATEATATNTATSTPLSTESPTYATQQTQTHSPKTEGTSPTDRTGTAQSTATGTEELTTVTTEEPATTTRKPTTTPKATTTTSEPPFSCPGRGYFSDPQDCYMFFRCFSSGNNFQHLRCRHGSFYDPTKRFCVPGKCS